MAFKMKPKFTIVWACVTKQGKNIMMPLLCTTEAGMCGVYLINIAGQYVKAIATIVYNAAKPPKEGPISARRVKKLTLE